MATKQTHNRTEWLNNSNQQPEWANREHTGDDDMSNRWVNLCKVGAAEATPAASPDRGFFSEPARCVALLPRLRLHKQTILCGNRMRPLDSERQSSAAAANR